MFKRVEKRRRKKEEEEELGLDEDMKEVLGIQDTDSDESDSDSDSDSQDSSDQEVSGNLGEDKDEGEDDDDDEEGASEDQSDNEEEKLPALTVADALEDPIYLVSLEPDVKGCISCPGKLLKHAKMIDIHKSSGAHRRRFTKFKEIAANANPDDIALDVLKNDGPTQLAADKKSRRAEKRKIKLAAVKARRDRQKEAKAKAKAKQKEKAAQDKAAAAPSSSESPEKPAVEEPAKKKRKLDKEGKSKRTQHQPPPSISQNTGGKPVRYKYSAEGHKRGEMKSKKDKKSTRGKGKFAGRKEKAGPVDNGPGLQIFD